MLKNFPIWAWNSAWWYTQFQNSFHGLILHLIWTLQWSLLNVRIWTFSWVWHEHCNGLFNIRNLVSSLILFQNHINIFFVWYYSLHLIWEEMEAIKKFWDGEICLICLVYACFFKHQSLSMLISLMLIKKEFMNFKLVPITDKDRKLT